MSGPLFKSFCVCLIRLLTLVAGLLGPSQVALAQSEVEPPPTYETVDAMGVELSSGHVQISSPTISVGDPGNGGLAFSAYWDGGAARAWRYSNWGGINKQFIKYDPYCYAYYTVTFMGHSNIFQLDSCGGNFHIIDGVGTLKKAGSTYTYTAPDGTVGTYSTSVLGTDTYLAGARPDHHGQ